MFNITPKYKNMLKHNKRPFSTFDKPIKQKPNQTFNEYISKDLTINYNNNEEKSAKKYYFNASYRQKFLDQRKLFYNRLSNNNLNKNEHNFSDILGFKKSRINNMKIKDYSNNSRLSSAATFRKINIRAKSLKKREEFKSYEYYNKERRNIIKIDKYCEINEEEFKKIYKTNNDKNNSSSAINKRGQVSVSMLLNRKKDIPEKLDIEPEDVNSDEIKTKNEYILKFGNISEKFKKILSYSDYINIDFRTTFINATINLTKKFEMYYIILLNKITNENCFQSLYDFCEEILSWQRLVMEEIRHLKKDNIFLNKRKKSLEKKLNIQKKEIKKINENIIKYDLLKVKKGKMDESKVEKIKKDFIDIESAYVNTIYQLQKEKSQLTDLLDKNKKEKIDNEELREKIKELKGELAKNKALMIQKEYNQKNNDALHSIFIEELSEKISGFEKEKSIWNGKENTLNEEILQFKIKLERKNEVIKEKENKIEELQKKINEKEINSLNENNNKSPVNTQFISEIKFK